VGKLFSKELRLSASVLSYLFIFFAFMTMIPGYPILMGAFFVSFGIFHSFQFGRESNDIMYSALLPVSKKDVVRGKFAFCVFIEMCGFAVMAALTVLRMTVFSRSAVYLSNALMNANLVFLGFALLIFGCFNLVFTSGFFKTGYYFGKPFVKFIIAAFVITAAGESLHHFPGFEALNAFGTEHLGLQLCCLAAGAVLYAVMTAAALKLSEKRFERIDL